MRNSTFSQLLQYLKNLTPLQKEKVEDLLHHTDAIDTLSTAIDKPESYPHCSSKNYQNGECVQTYSAIAAIVAIRPLIRRGSYSPMLCVGVVDCFKRYMSRTRSY